MVACYLSVLNGRKLGNNKVEMKPHSQEAEGMGCTSLSVFSGAGGWGGGWRAGSLSPLPQREREKTTILVCEK